MLKLMAKLFFLLYVMLSAVAAAGADAVSEDGSVVAFVDGVPIRREQVYRLMATADKMYGALTVSLDPEEIEAKKRAAKRQILDNLIDEQILLNKIKEAGIVLTPEQQASAAREYLKKIDTLALNVRKSYPALSESELDKTIDSILKMSGVTREQIRKNIESAILKNALFDRVRLGITVAGEQLARAYYDELVDEQVSEFDGDISRYEQALLEDRVIVYRPADCRVIKQIYLQFDEDIIALINQFLTYDLTTDAEAIRADQHKRQNARVEEILRRLRQDRFETIMEEEKPGSGEEKNYICAGSRRFPPEYKDATLNIDEVGGLSAPIKLEYGTAILYLSDIIKSTGKIQFSDVREQVEKCALEELRDRKLEEAKTRWKNEAKTIIFEENLL
ncbi:MAG: SurA N-terminal domain-containing protein [Synergistaceae bacterium]|jgi:parvulin-like peptidyl-prolyl isomerase|nr:SurA N-terminal domain-containing protein [Synergistaceae bacterium]